MSDYHILEGGEDGNAYRVAFHIPIPDILNDVNVSYRTALSQFRKLTDTTWPPSAVRFIIPAEQTQLDNGELYEYVETFQTNPGMTLPEKRAALDARYLALVTPVQNRLGSILRYWGYSRDVP